MNRIVSQVMDQNIPPEKASEAQIRSLPTIVNGQDTTECYICFDSMEPGTSILEILCRHSFHQDCLKLWLLYNNMPFVP